jgi:D-xylose 1-dehydrogenase (NADP+, D-xylono-1,5-lactone-forming)
VEPVRWGIVSTARINRAIVPALRESPCSELVAVASRSQERADAYAAEQGIPRAYGSYDALLADPEIEAVYISVPNALHAEWSVRAFEAGKHVLCEKPFTRDPEEAERAFDAATRAGRLLMEAFMWRHHPQTRTLVELAGRIGALRFLRASFSFTVDDGNVRLDPVLGGGALMDVGCYCVSGLRLLAGEPVAVSAQQVTAPTGVDVRMVATLVFAGDVYAQFDCAFDQPLRQRLEVVGAEGTVNVPWPWNAREPGLELRRGDEVEWIAIDDVSPYRLQCDNFSRAVRGLEPPLLGRDDALGQARTIDALYRSAADGGTLARL